MDLAASGDNHFNTKAPVLLTKVKKSTEYHQQDLNVHESKDVGEEETCQHKSKRAKLTNGQGKAPLAFPQQSRDLRLTPTQGQELAVCDEKFGKMTKEKRFSTQDFYSVNNVNSSEKHMELRDEDECGFDWMEMLTEPGFVTSSVACFRHVPLSDTWISDAKIDMRVEVVNTDALDGDRPSFWVASIVRLMGYKALLRYEGFDSDDSKDFWVNLATKDAVKPIGWCVSHKKKLHPPRTIQAKYSVDWQAFLIQRLTNKHGFPGKFDIRFNESLKSRFRTGMNVELVDRHRISIVKVATVEKIIGRRLLLRYVDSPPDDAGFWCHEESNLIHPVGWALDVGHPVDASPKYLQRCQTGQFLPSDTTSDMFPRVDSGVNDFKEGMKLEAVDPLSLYNICVATVAEVLRHGYLMIRLDGQEDEDDDGDSVFCYHSSSACIAPAGFCAANGIALQPPKNYQAIRQFRWRDYLLRTGSVAAPESLFRSPPHRPAPELRVGERVEATDLMDPSLVCVATIARIAGRLVRIHFDGWADNFDQWMDVSSPEIYPIGWCELTGYRLQPPVATIVTPVVKKRRRTNQIGKWRRSSRQSKVTN